MSERPATAITFDLLAVLCAVGAGLAILWGPPGSLLPPVLTGAAAVLLAGGAAASAGDRTGRLLDGIAGLLVPAAVLAPLAWVTRRPAPSVALVALLALGLGLLAFYAVARARSLGFPAPGGILVRVLAGSAVAAALVLRGPGISAGISGEPAGPPMAVLAGIDWVVAFLLTAAIIEAVGAGYVAWRVTIEAR